MDLWRRLRDMYRNARVRRKVAEHVEGSDLFYKLGIEITSACNYRCPFCPQSKSARPEAYMSFSSVSLIVEQLVALRYAGEISLSVTNEPFCHPRCLEFAGLISKKLPKCNLRFNSNGSLIDKIILGGLHGISTPFIAQINDYTGGRELSRLGGLLSGYDAEFQSRFILKRRSFGERLSTRGGAAQSRRRRDYFGDFDCLLPYFRMDIGTDGSVILCCADYRYQMAFGNIHTAALKDIWNSEEFRELRRTLFRGKRRSVSLCSRCDMAAPGLPQWLTGSSSA